MRIWTVLFPPLIALAGSAMAGTVTVSFVNPASYTDIGISPSDREAAMQELGTHLQLLGQRYLAPNQHLDAELLDVDLAGKSRPWRRGEFIRIITSPADWPRIRVRYSLSVDGKVVSHGEDALTDMDYVSRISRYREGEPYRHEKAMLDDWFRSRFLVRQAQH